MQNSSIGSRISRISSNYYLLTIFIKDLVNIEEKNIKNVIVTSIHWYLNYMNIQRLTF